MVKSFSTHNKTRWNEPYMQRSTRYSISWIAIGLLLLLWLAPHVYGAVPIFENRTPVGFSTADSTIKENFVLGAQVTVRADLNQAATPTYPVIGHFHNIERSKQVEDTDVDGMQVDVAVDGDGTLHMAWISQSVVSPISTPVYHVNYARSEDKGKSFSNPISVSGTLRFDLLTLNVAGNSSGFSTLDIEVDSRGNPRVAYAMNASPDGHTAKFTGSGDADNVYFNYSQNGGASWLPGDRAIVVNDSVTVGNTQGRASTFPRLVVDQRDNLFISYVRGSSQGTGNDDIMLANVDRSTTPFTMNAIGSLGTAGSSGGVRISPEAGRHTGVDMAVGTGDVLHMVYFNDAGDDIEHKTLLADSWSTVGGTGWNQTIDGADVDNFIDESTVAAIESDAHFFFPTVAVDKQSSPDKVYAVYKFGDATFETVAFNRYTYDNAIGASAGWLTTSAAPIWSTATSPIFSDGNQNYNIELEWTVTERVAVVVDDRLPDRGEVHIAFSAGYSSGGEHDIYYGFYNGSSWTLPEKVADDDSDAATEDGIVATDVFLSSPALAKASNDTSLYLVFAGGTGEGLGVNGISDVNHHPYLKVLGRAISSEDESVPVGAYAYNLNYTPINTQSLSTEITNNIVYVHVADNGDGSGLGATGKHSTDGFLAGDWETVATTLADDNKDFEGRFNEDASTTNEWGDDDDKIGLLVKLNVLGSDSATNIQVITNSTASAAGTGLGARTVRVGTDPTGAFVSAGSFFILGADIDIVDSNTAPSVEILQPDGLGDEANTSYPISYRLSDIDDDISTTGLLVALYFSPDSSLASVQDIRIFGTLIADENDHTNVFASGTNDLIEGRSESYTWDDPPASLKAKLFASINQAISGNYYIYLVADDQKNPPVFTRSPGALTVKHTPIIVHVDPANSDTVDTGVRSGAKANPYDLDFTVRDFDLQGTAEIQLFYSSVSGLNSVSVIGLFPNQEFTLGKSVAGVRAIPITHTDTLTSIYTEFTWDVTDSVAVRVGASIDSQSVAEGSYFLYLVASDSVTTTVGQSQASLTIKHSPSFTFYEPSRDTHRKIGTGSQPIYTVQWQKGRGDQDFDNDATIDLYFTTDNPATVNYEDFPDSLLKDGDTQVIVKGLTEDLEGASDMYTWDLRHPTNDVPRNNRKVWLYAIISDVNGNSTTALGGALTMTHDPRITLLSSKLDDYGSFLKNDVLRVTWDDYMIDDGSGTDDAYIRLYASTQANLATLAAIEADVGTNGFLINSSNGLNTGTITSVREDSINFFDWNTKLFGAASTAYYVYAAISQDATFSDNTSTSFSRSSAALSVGATGATPNISLSPTDQVVAFNDTVTLDVVVQHTSPINFVQVILKFGDSSFSIVDQSTQTGLQPFIDLNEVFSGTIPIENRYDTDTSKLRFSKSTFQGELVGSTSQPARLARFQLVPIAGLVASPSVTFATGETGSVVGVVGKTDPLDSGEGLSLVDPQFTRVSRGKIAAIVELEGRTLGSSDYTTFLDIHLRQPGSTIDITDAVFKSANDGITATSDTIEVKTSSAGALTLSSVPAGRYVLTVKDTSHVSGRTDTFTVTNGQTVTVGTDFTGFFGSDLRGDPTTTLPSTGQQLIAGDVSEDNEINEDDVNIIIAAWGTTTTVANFKQADLNNDSEVGAADLTATTSNFGNSEGFGAPPVFKRAVAGENGAAEVEMLPLFDPRQSLWEGRQIEVVIQARNLDDLAGYEFDLNFDPRSLRLLPSGSGQGDIFALNPRGAIFETRTDSEGKLRVMASRYGKEWSAKGDGELARLRFEVLREDALETLTPGAGVLLSTAYSQEAVRWSGSLLDWILPQAPGLEQNFPNPFNPSTIIPLALPQRTKVRLDIFNVLGQRVRTLVDGPLDAGYHNMAWNGLDEAGRQAAAGMYFYLVETDGFRQTRKMTLVK
jgi:hypothetical protein